MRNKIMFYLVLAVVNLIVITIFEGCRPITAHATDYADIKKQLPKAGWVNNVGVTHWGNLYSTAGVPQWPWQYMLMSAHSSHATAKL